MEVTSEATEVTTETVQGTVKPDGTLELDRRLAVSPGRVRVRVEVARPGPPRSAAEVRAIVERIWARRRARGAMPRSAEEATAEVRKMRQEAEERFERLERLTTRGRDERC